MRSELISVIVPVHNGQAYLENCIDSIAGQSYDDLEILIVNDGSTDRTGEVCAGLREKYENITVFTLADLGVSTARNYAIERAKGAYVTFVDADDRLCPGMLQYLYERITATDSDLAGCRFRTWSTEEEWKIISEGTEEERRVLCRSMEQRDGVLTAEDRNLRTAGAVQEKFYDSRQYLKESILRDNCRCWSKLYRRQLIDQVRFREGLTVGEDMLYLVDILPFLHKAVETTYPGYGYYQNPGGVMQRPFTPSYMDQIRCWEIAQEMILGMDEALKPQTAAKIITAVMLTVGKIALCTVKERRKAEDYLEQCRKKLQEHMQVAGYAAYLPGGYRLKASLFSHLPGVYIWLYRVLQEVKRNRK